MFRHGHHPGTIPWRLRHGVQQHVALHVLRGGFEDEAIAQGAREPTRVAQQEALLVREDEFHLKKKFDRKLGAWNG